MKECPNGHEVSDTVKFCPQCGAEIQDKLAEEIRFCKKCGHERNGAEKFCSHCGFSFYGEPEYSSSNIESVRNNAFNKKIISLLIVIPLLFVCGYYIYNHVEEEKRFEKERIEENERIAEAERKRIEEENKPDNKFYKLATNSNYVWATSEGSVKGKNDKDQRTSKIYLYFYPKNKESGDVSVLTWWNYYSMFIGRGSSKSQYRVRNGNSIYFKFRNKPSGWSGNIYEYEYVLDIINDGDNVKLVRLDGQEYQQEWKNKEDPLR